MTNTTGAICLRTEATREDASRRVATRLAVLLAEQLQKTPTASLVVSGGSSPRACFHLLQNADLDWSRVRVTLTDERCVPTEDAESNERMVRRELLQGRAGRASFVKLADESLASLEKPYAASLIGMGADGHFASIFPGLPELGELLDPDGRLVCKKVVTGAKIAARMTMSLAELVRSRRLLLLAFGAEKKAVLDAAAEYPVGALLAQRRAPIEVVWAP